MKAVVARVKGLLLSPRTEWEAVVAEEVPLRRLVAGYVVPLIALPALATVVGLAVVQRVAPVAVAVAVAVFVAVAVAVVLAVAVAVDRLAPRFGAERNFGRAFTLTAYSITAASLAGVLSAIPALGVLALLGAAYSLYLLFLGTPKMMRAPAASAVNYSITATLTALALALAAGFAAMAASPRGSLFPPMTQLSDFGPDSAAGPLADTATVRPEALPPSAGELRDGGPGDVAGGETGGETGSETGSDLRGAAPASLAGLQRVSVGLERRGITGARTVELDAEYRRGRRYIVLRIVYSDSIAETIGFAGPATSEYDRETGDGYARRSRIGEAIVTEEWNRSSRTGSYARLFGDRFYVKAGGGGGVTPAELRDVVELFGRGTMEQFAAAR